MAKTEANPTRVSRRDELTAHIHKGLKRLRKIGPEIAGSPRAAEEMRKSTRRMTRWAADLRRGKARRRLAAEAERIRRRAADLTGSEKKARSLRAVTADIELAVRRLHKNT